MGYVAALVLTLAVEVPVYATGVRAIAARSCVAGSAAGIAVNLATHPVSFLAVVPALAGAVGYLPALAADEAAVVIAEALLLVWWLRRDAWLLLALSSVANLLSLAIGLLVLR